MQVRVKEFDLESMKNSLGKSTVELPEEIKVHWQSYGDHWDFPIKYISTYGAGFPRRWDGCKYVSINEHTKCTMPDGTVFDIDDSSYGETESIRVYTFVNKIIKWAEKHARPKLRLSDETEFMDI
jgi:hypothetical protein